MILIKIMGGFASQLNKYILGYQVAHKLGTELAIDVRDYFSGYFRPYALCYIDLPVCEIITSDTDMAKHTKFKLIRNSTAFTQMIENNKENYYLDREECDYKEALKKYRMLEISPESIVLQKIKFKFPANFYDSFCDKIAKDTFSVAIHIRRGDFVRLGWQDDLSFYQAAIAWFMQREPNTQFYFFSSDIWWVKEKFPSISQFHYVNSIDGIYGDIQEVFCMAKCDCRILSRFSGYGRLANIYAATQKKKRGFAVMSINTIQNGEENQSVDKELTKFYENEINQFEAIKKEEGGIVYFVQEVIDKYSRLYANIMEDKSLLFDNAHSVNKLKKIDEISVDIMEVDKTEFQKLLLQRYFSYKEAGIPALQRDCLERMASSKYVSRLWAEWYHVAGEANKKIYIITDEKLNRWKINGMFLLAFILSRCGASVYYINWKNIVSDIMARRRDGAEYVKAQNMDGIEFPFLCYNGLNKSIDWDGILSNDYQNKYILLHGVLPRKLKLNKNYNYIRIIHNDTQFDYKNRLLCGLTDFKLKMIHLNKIKYMRVKRQHSNVRLSSEINSSSDIYNVLELPYLELINHLQGE